MLEDKWSRHLVVRLPGVALASNAVAGAIVQRLGCVGEGAGGEETRVAYLCNGSTRGRGRGPMVNGSWRSWKVVRQEACFWRGHAWACAGARVGVNAGQATEGISRGTWFHGDKPA